MKRYMPLLTIALAFITAVWTYVYYADCQYAKAENANKEIKKEELNQPKQKLVSVEAKHILVKTLEEAENLRNRISRGEEFEKIAQEVSLCPSGRFGGDLGYIQKGQMVKEFEKIAFSTPKGEVSKPVKTQFGWHLIIVTNTIYTEAQQDLGLIRK